MNYSKYFNITSFKNIVIYLIDKFLYNFTLNAQLSTKYKQITGLNNTNVTNSRRVAAYLGHHQSSGVFLKYILIRKR